MSIREWPQSERPREKLLKQGAQVLSDAELLAIFLRTGVAGKSAIRLARELLASAGGLRGLLSQTCNQVCQNKGVGEAKFVQFQAALELGKRYLFEQIDKQDALTSPTASRNYLRYCLRDKPYEVFYALFLDSKHQVIHHQELFRGSINSATVPVREVVKEALKYNAAALIVAHNHPSGIAEPSQSDNQLTESLEQALSLVDVRLLDHFIVGESEVVSYAEMGKLG